MKATQAAALAAGMLALGACSATQGSTTPASATTAHSSTPPSAPATSGPTTQSGNLPSDLLGFTNYGDECPGAITPQIYDGAAPYQGPGPHPIVFVDPGDSTDLNNFFTDASNPNNKVPDGTFSGEPHNWIPPDIASVQLVACVVDNFGEITNYSPTPVLAHDCGTYKPQGGGSPFDVGIDYGSYTITLINARTGKQVAPPVTIMGQQIPRCPSKVSYPSGIAIAVGAPTPLFYTILSTSQAESLFGRYVDSQHS